MKPEEEKQNKEIDIKPLKRDVKVGVQ